jgi:hypothetical protein
VHRHVIRKSGEECRQILLIGGLEKHSGALDRVLAGGEDLGDAHDVGVVETGAEILEQRGEPRVAVRLVHGDDARALRSATACRAAFRTAAISTGWWP